MDERDEYNKAFNQERFGPGAGVPTTFAGAMGQMAARQQTERRPGPGPSGHVLLEMLAAGPISRGLLAVVAGFALAVAGANGARGSWLTTAAFVGGWVVLTAGVGLIAFGVVRAVVRAVRRMTAR